MLDSSVACRRMFFAAAVAVLLAACSTNAGFGTPATEPQPVGPGLPQPESSAVLPPGGAFNPNPEASPAGSPQPTPTPVPNTLSIVGASLRLAYDGSAKDPVKAPRALELTFALQNTTQSTAKISTVSARADTTSFPDLGIAVSAPANQTSQVASVVVKMPGDPSKYKNILFSFLDPQKKMIGSVRLDVPVPDESFTGLDEKHPRGVLSLDGAEVSPISNGAGQWFECTFAITNPAISPASISEFQIKPPKGATLSLAIPMLVPSRSASGFISIVVPYNGKSLPSGSYAISARQNGAAIASASAVLL